MYRDSSTTAINETVNRQLLNHNGMPISEAGLLAAAITALHADYRLVPEDTRIALRLLHSGTSIPGIAAALRPL